MKHTSVKRGVQGAIALAQSHGKEVDWGKIVSSRACPLFEMLEFFKKAKEYAPSIVSLITPLAASLTVVHCSSTSPPSVATADSSAPSNTTNPAAEVA
jgi:hypothetical protein